MLSQESALLKVARREPVPLPKSFFASRLARPAAARRIAWRYAIPLPVFHALALLACWPWLFSWSGFWLLIAGIYFYGAFGINICYHRLLTHRSFEVPRWLEYAFVVVSLCCMEDAPASWVATHRLHHQHSDERPDPHSPLVSFLWSHVGWLLVENPDARSTSAYDRYARDILKDPFYMRLQRTLLPVWIYLAHAAVYYFAGVAVGWWLGGTLMSGVQLGLSWLVWGVILRTVIVWHISWSVNSLSHMGGYRNYDTGENSQNNWIVAFLTTGEGWHNNHHMQPTSASNWHRWWEVDPMYMIIRGLEMVGLAKNVVRPKQRHLASRSRKVLAKPR